MLNLNSIMVGTMRMPIMADFYDKVFDKSPIWLMKEAAAGRQAVASLVLWSIQKHPDRLKTQPA